jgi:hypothetical protein
MTPKMERFRCVETKEKDKKKAKENNGHSLSKTQKLQSD